MSCWDVLSAAAVCQTGCGANRMTAVNLVPGLATHQIINATYHAKSDRPPREMLWSSARVGSLSLSSSHYLSRIMFVLLKLLLFFFRPVVWIVLLFAYALLTKHAIRKRFAFRLAFALLLFFTNPFISNTLISLYETKPAQFSPAQRFNAGILLGGMVAYNATEDRGYFNGAADRFIQTALLYKQGRIGNVIVAAGNGYLTGNSFSEALFIKARLVELGVPAEKIYTDSESRNTLQNAQNSKHITDSASLGPPYLLISSALHLPRAARVFRKAGINPVLYPCNFLAKDTRDNFLEDYLLPSALALSRWDNFIKELLGILTYSVTGKS